MQELHSFSVDGSGIRGPGHQDHKPPRTSLYLCCHLAMLPLPVQKLWAQHEMCLAAMKLWSGIPPTLHDSDGSRSILLCTDSQRPSFSSAPVYLFPLPRNTSANPDWAHPKEATHQDTSTSSNHCSPGLHC